MAEMTDSVLESITALKDIEIWRCRLELRRSERDLASREVDYSQWRPKLAHARSQGMITPDVYSAIIRGEFQDIQGACDISNCADREDMGAVRTCARASGCNKRLHLKIPE